MYVTFNRAWPPRRIGEAKKQVTRIFIKMYDSS